MSVMATRLYRKEDRENLTPKKAEEWQPIFLKVLAKNGNIRGACAAAGISRQVAYEHRRRNKTFGQLWDVALEQAVDALEAIAWKRAMESSDTLVIFLLKANRPWKYRDRIDITLTQVVEDTRRWAREQGLPPEAEERAVQEAMQIVGKRGG